MANGYVTAEATAISPISTFDASGSQGGEETGLFWIHWTSEGGFTGTNNWYYEEVFSAFWPEHAHEFGDYSADSTGFLAYVGTNPANLDTLFSYWDPISKSAFVGAHADDLGVYGGQYGEGPGCIEYRG